MTNKFLHLKVLVRSRYHNVLFERDSPFKSQTVASKKLFNRNTLKTQTQKEIKNG